ncbi:TPA: hypothetical protein ACG0AV_002079 [Elizabethkingia anophelis]
MNPAELRIGNYVKVKGLINPRQVLIQDLVDASNISPIHITEEWLLKLGFEHTTIIYVKGMVLRLVDKHLVGGFEDNEYGIEHEVKINYVHQLQNLFYALTGQELKL